MAYCPICHDNFPIITSIESSETTPRCSNCYTKLIFPNAMSNEEISKIYEDRYDNWKKSAIPTTKKEIDLLKKNLFYLRKQSKFRISNFINPVLLILFVLVIIHYIIKIIELTPVHYMDLGNKLRLIGNMAMAFIFFVFAVITGVKVFDKSSYGPSKAELIIQLKEKLSIKEKELQEIEKSKYRGFDYKRNSFKYY